ncbi:MAG: hypothetical protein CMJ49_04065 [Planctomycetaceae bacterium]|nr:hypothetical protein [Planctomycetaceae bacterium]
MHPIAMLQKPDMPTFRRSRVWKFCIPVSLALVGFALFFAGVRLARPGTVFYYTEGPVLGSLAALEAAGDVADLYPSDSWQEPPVVLTLYPPGYFLAAAAADRAFGTVGTLLGLRAVSALAFLGLLGLLALHTLRRRAPAAWVLAIAAASLITPAVYRLISAAQPDPLALFLTWLGIWAVLDPRGRRIRRGAAPLCFAGLAFFCAFFAKQSFVAAPAAVALTLAIDGRLKTGLIFAALLIVTVVVTVFLLDTVTDGGYLANTVGALTVDAGWANLWSTFVASAPIQWLPILAGVLIAGAARRPRDFAGLYFLGSAALHIAAMLKTGSSVNYFLEPTFALLLLATIRWPSQDDESSLPGKRTPRRRHTVVASILAVAMFLPAAHAAWKNVPELKMWTASTMAPPPLRFEGHPLVEAHFFPAVLASGERPWLNDPFAFGAMLETGRWDPARLVTELEQRRVPFALTEVNPDRGPAPQGAGSRELVFEYFWRAPPIWNALTRSYIPARAESVTAWLPRADDAPHD